MHFSRWSLPDTLRMASLTSNSCFKETLHAVSTSGAFSSRWFKHVSLLSRFRLAWYTHATSKFYYITSDMASMNGSTAGICSWWIVPHVSKHVCAIKLSRWPVLVLFFLQVTVLIDLMSSRPEIHSDDRPNFADEHLKSFSATQSCRTQGQIRSAGGSAIWCGSVKSCTSAEVGPSCVSNLIEPET